MQLREAVLRGLLRDVLRVLRQGLLRERQLRAVWPVVVVQAVAAAAAAAVVAVVPGAVAVEAAAVLARSQLLRMLRGLHCATRLCVVALAAVPLSLLGRRWVCTWQPRRRAVPQHPAVPRGSASLRLCFIVAMLALCHALLVALVRIAGTVRSALLRSLLRVLPIRRGSSRCVRRKHLAPRQRRLFGHRLQRRLGSGLRPRLAQQAPRMRRWRRFARPAS